jgi:hypothetical protein
VNACPVADAGTIELHFYGELEPAEAARLAPHVRGCAVCRQHLEDLRAIREALAARPRVDAPPAGDWSGFMRRLDASVGAKSTARPAGARNGAAWIAIAATLTLVTSGVYVTSRIRHQPAAGAQARAASNDPAPVVPASYARASASTANRSLVEHSEEHFERSKLVVLGLATLDPRHARSGDWEHERELAGSLLPDTRLYRLAAEERGMTNLARVLGDLETVLLETSMSDHADAQALERVQRLIARRDLVVKMNVVGSGI